MTELVLVPEPRCACGAALHEDEGDRCAFCRRDERGDEELLCHDERGWIGEGGRRVPCRCGCGMVSVPEPVEVERPATVVPFIRPDTYSDEDCLHALREWASEHDGKPPSITDWTSSKRRPSYATIAKRLGGSWNGAIRAAGLQPNTHNNWAERQAQRQATGKAHAVGSGQDAHAWADALGNVEGLVVKFRHELPEHSQALLKTLGATYIVSPTALPCEGPCGDPACARDEPMRPAPKPTSLDSELSRLAGELER